MIVSFILILPERVCSVNRVCMLLCSLNTYSTSGCSLQYHQWVYGLMGDARWMKIGERRHNHVLTLLYFLLIGPLDFFSDYYEEKLNLCFLCHVRTMDFNAIIAYTALCLPIFIIKEIRQPGIIPDKSLHHRK